MNLPQLRDDLKITPLSGAEQGLYVIEDPLRNVFFRIGAREYRFLCRLEGTALMEDFDEGNGTGEDLSKEEALTLLKWLGAKQLLKNLDPKTLQQIDQAEQQARKKARGLARYNPIIFRVPLFNPDPLLTKLMPWIGWLAGPLFLVVWMVLGLVAVILLFTNWDQFLYQSRTFFSPANLLIIGLIWIVLKVVHELGHSVACRRHGGRVYEVGVLFILFIPLTYVNGTSSWSFPNRWQRIQVGTAGMFMELFAAWCALIYWALHMDSPAGLIAHHTVLVAGVSSLLFNANPLMRFDGYYILSDLVKVPNLYFRGLADVRRIIDRLFFGIDPPTGSDGSHPLITFYGFAVYFWRILVLVTLSILAMSLFGGWGLVLAVVAIGGWLYQSVSTMGARINAHRQQDSQVIGRFLLRIGLLGGLCMFLLFGLNYRENLSSPAVVSFEEQESLRAEAPGFIERIMVDSGDSVEAGQLLVVLTNDELEAELKDLQAQLAIAELKKRQADVRGERATAQVVGEQIEVLREKEHNLTADQQALNIAAPSSGMVVGELDSRIGTFVHRGEELLQIIGPDDKQLVAAVNQNDIVALRSAKPVEVTVDMRTSGLGTFRTHITDISPTASSALTHFSLAAPFGGPLDVKAAQDRDDSDAYEYFLPHFSVSLALPDEIKSLSRSGQQALIFFKGVEKPPVAHLWQRIRNWFETKRNQENLTT